MDKLSYFLFKAELDLSLSPSGPKAAVAKIKGAQKSRVVVQRSTGSLSLVQTPIPSCSREGLCLEASTRKKPAYGEEMRRRTPAPPLWTFPALARAVSPSSLTLTLDDRGARSVTPLYPLSRTELLPSGDLS